MLTKYYFKEEEEEEEVSSVRILARDVKLIK